MAASKVLLGEPDACQYETTNGRYNLAIRLRELIWACALSEVLFR